MKKDVSYLYECDDVDFSEKEELKEDSLYDEKLEKFLKKLEKKLHSEHQFHTVYGVGKNKIVVEIEWGDWKHEHMFTDDIVEELICYSVKYLGFKEKEHPATDSQAETFEDRYFQVIYDLFFVDIATGGDK